MSNQKKLARHSNIQKPRKLQTGDAARSLNGQTISKRRKKRTQAIKHLTPKKIMLVNEKDLAECKAGQVRKSSLGIVMCVHCFWQKK